MLTSNSFFGSEPQTQCTLMPGLDADEAQTQHCRVEQCYSVGCLGKVPCWFQDENADASDERVQHVLEASRRFDACSSSNSSQWQVCRFIGAPEAFKKYDKDGDGMIDFVELGALMRGLAGSAAEWTDASIKVLLTAMDSDNDGKVVLSDFGVWLFGTQLSPMEESKLKTAELTLQASNAKAKAQSKAAAKAKGKAKAKAKPVPEEEEEEGEDEEGGDYP